MMKSCPECNKDNVDYANHCSYCGYSFKQDSVNVVDGQDFPDKYNQQNLSNETNMANADIQNNAYHQQYPTSSQVYANQQVKPQNQKSKIIGLLLNIIVVGLGYAYVGKWGEGVVLLFVYLLMWILGFFLVFPWIIAIALWVYSLIKTNQMIDKYNNGIPY